jgi:hypothetical protein
LIYAFQRFVGKADDFTPTTSTAAENVTPPPFSLYAVFKAHSHGFTVVTNDVDGFALSSINERWENEQTS